MYNTYPYNNSYYGYTQPQMPQQNQPQPQMTQQMSFVNGIEGAKGFIVPPNTSVFLMDSDAEQFFLKTADRNGMCNIKAYTFQEIELNKQTQTTVDTNNFVTREEFNKLLDNVNNLLTPKENKKGLL